MGFSRSGPARADVRKWKGADPNALISGRVDANAQVVGDKTGYTVSTNQDKTGYSVSTNNDKTGYSLTAGSYSVRASSSQRGTVSLGSGTGSANISIASVTTTRASSAHSARSDVTTDVGAAVATGQITAATTVGITRGVTSGTLVGAAEVWELF